MVDRPEIGMDRRDGASEPSGGGVPEVMPGEAASTPRLAADTRELLDAFARALDACAGPSGRETALGPLLGRIRERAGAEAAALYLPADTGAGLERVWSAGEVAAPAGTVLRQSLVWDGANVGVLELAGGAFSPEDRALVELAAVPLAVAIRTLDRFERSERLTITDDLTLLYNYRYLKKYLEAEVKRCLRYKKKVSLLFIDIDEFKCINDTFGHLVGSRALAEMGQVFKKCVRETDVVGRYGGDEFVIVLPETPLGGALAVAERIRKRVEGFEFAARNLSLRLTVSLGVANCPRHTLTAEGLIRKADAAMYRAKELSRNSIKVAV